VNVTASLIVMLSFSHLWYLRMLKVVDTVMLEELQRDHVLSTLLTSSLSPNAYCSHNIEYDNNLCVIAGGYGFAIYIKLYLDLNQQQMSVRAQMRIT
jgi:hypothetical protein